MRKFLSVLLMSGLSIGVLAAPQAHALTAIALDATGGEFQTTGIAGDAYFYIDAVNPGSFPSGAGWISQETVNVNTVGFDSNGKEFLIANYGPGALGGWSVSYPSSTVRAPLHFVVPSGANDVSIASLITLAGGFDGSFKLFLEFTDGLFVIPQGATSISPFLTTVPIPGALSLFSAGLGAFGFFGWRRRQRSS